MPLDIERKSSALLVGNRGVRCAAWASQCGEGSLGVAPAPRLIMRLGIHMNWLDYLTFET